MHKKLATLLLIAGMTTAAAATENAGYEVLVNPDTTLAGPFTPSNEYIAAQQPHPMLELGYRYRMPYVGIYPSDGANMHLNTEPQPLISAFIYWKWLKVGWNFALENINKGFNFNYAINMGPMNLSMTIAHIRNLRLIKEADYNMVNFEDDETRLRKLAVTDYDLNVEWKFNKRYALLSGYDYSYHRTQLKSQGTGIVAAGYSYNGLKKRHSFGQTAQADAVTELLPLDKAGMHMVNLGGGYGHNFAFAGGRLVLGMVCVPYLTGGLSAYTYDSQEESGFAYGLRAHGRLNLTYNYRYGGISLSGEYNGAFINDNDFKYRRDVVNIRLNHAFRLGEFGVKSGKIPGHKIMDTIQEFLAPSREK